MTISSSPDSIEWPISIFLLPVTNFTNVLLPTLVSPTTARTCVGAVEAMLYNKERVAGVGDSNRVTARTERTLVYS
jgi:hypothetical protein